MNQVITKSQIAKMMSEMVGTTNVEAIKYLDAYLCVTRSILRSGDQIEIRGHFTSKVKTVKKRPGRNPRTGISVEIPERRKVVCKMSKHYL